ncbi:MAG TPA: MBL fold metallo-hydrolase [Gammaproteobacteria bacterium]|nr:MBL fold metallo-hydrolase [Gammaproteobacteria bacterium]
MSTRLAIIVACAAALSLHAGAQEAPREATVTSEQLQPGLHVLYGSGGGQVSGNVLVLIGDQGSLVVDTGYPVHVPLYRQEIAKLGGGAVTHVINTHFHDDHSEGNKIFGPAALIVAHSNVRHMLMQDNKINVVRTILDQPAFPPAALPVVTFDDRIELYFGSERLELVHVSPAHTAGDVAVILRGKNVMHTGDVFLPAAYPFSDVDNGGDFEGEIEFCRELLKRIDRDTTIVPGHGRTATYADLEAYIAMLETVRGRLFELIASGATLPQVVAAQPTKEFDAKYGNPTTYFLDRSYKSLGGRSP